MKIVRKASLRNFICNKKHNLKIAMLTKSKLHKLTTDSYKEHALRKK